MSLDPKRRFYLDGYGQHPEWYTWHYEMLKRLASIDNDIVNQVIKLPATSSDAFGRLRTSEPFTLFDSNFRYGDNGSWATSTATGGTTSFNSSQGLMQLNVTNSSGSSVIRETYKVFSYQPGKSLLLLNTFVMSPAKDGLRQRVGYFTTGNGYYLELDGTTLSFVERSSVSGSITNTPVNQSNWNYDKLDGTGPSGLILDITQAQILWFDMEWLGVGTVRMGFVINGQFILCHNFQHANLIDSTYITTACLSVRYEITNTAGTTGSSTLKQICSSVISEGGYELRGSQGSIDVPITTPRTFAAAGTYYPIIGLKLTASKLDSIVIPTGISVLGLGNGKNYSWRIVKGTTISGGSWVGVGASSAVEYNISGTTVSGGTILASGYLNSSNQGSPVVNILKDSLFATQLERNGLSGTAIELTLEAAVSTSSGGEGMLASVDWEEITK